MNVSTMARQSFKLVNRGNTDGGILVLPLVSLVLHMLKKLAVCEQRLHSFLNYYENLNFGISIPSSPTVCKIQQTN